MDAKETTPFDDRAESFLQVGDVAYYVAEKHSHVHVDDVTHERWRELMALLRETDTVHDDTDITDEETITLLEDFEFFKHRYPSLAPDMLDNDSRQLLVARVRRIMRLGAQVSASTSINRFVALRVNEGIQTANLLEDAATPYVKQQPAFTQSFMPTIRSFATVACTVDSMTDANQDYSAGKITYSPDRELYWHLIGTSLHHMKPGVTALMHPSVLRQFATMSVTRLKNRMHQGSRSTSSLNQFRR